jgi:hypothetical protein
VLRREAGETSLVQLNGDPIGGLETVAEIEALFTAPGYEDALAAIQTSLGGDYASDLLLLRQGGTTEDDAARSLLLPDQNYGAAITFGFGLMDDSVAAGTTYVYEVWGLDDLGFREERLGRAVATAGAPVPPGPVPQVDCVEIDDARGDMAVHLRWAEPAGDLAHYVPGYDVWRVAAAEGVSCADTPNGPGATGAVRANLFPSQRTSGGRTKLGAERFATACAACHAAPDPRNVDPAPLPAANGVKGGTLEEFYRLQYAEILPPGGVAQHDTPALTALDPEDVRAVFEWIQEFHLLDDGRHTPAEPLVEEQEYCYRVYPRDVLGQYGNVLDDGRCRVRDRSRPDVPWQILADRVEVGGTHETCEVSWVRNAETGDDTVEYALYRMSPDPPRAATDPAARVHEPASPQATIPQPGEGDRVSWLDPDLGPAQAGERFVYAVQAVDEAGNRSGFSGWVPCVPRDIVAPAPPSLALSCCDTGLAGCADTRIEPAWAEWRDLGGAPVIIFDPQSAICPGVTASLPLEDGAIGARIYRSFDGADWAAGADFEGTHEETFAPLIDSAIHLRARPFDASGNLGAETNGDRYFVKGLFPLPAPRIVSVAVNPQNDHLEVQFRSLAPENLLGFSLYVNHLGTDGQIPAEVGARVVGYHPANLAGPQANPASYPFQWVVLGGAAPLADRLPAAGPNGGSLAWDAIDELYILDVDPQGDPLEGMVLRLVAVGWSGAEGLTTPYAVGGQSDGILEWPTFRTSNHKGFTLLQDDLQATYNPGHGTIDVEWTANPGGCGVNDNRYFIVFRKRGPAPAWEQISPLIRCDPAQPAPFDMRFKDGDVEPGLGISYEYTVIRLTERGEFWEQYLPEVETP